MEKYILIILASALFVLTTCSSDGPEYNKMQDTGVVFSVYLPKDLSTRSVFGDGLQAEKLYFAVYDDKGNYVLDGSKSFENSNSTTVEIPLVNGMNYSVAFFACENAEGDSAPYTFNAEAGIFTANYDNMKTDYNKTDHDAFFAIENVNVNGNQSHTILLSRPVAQINWGTNDLTATEVTADDAYGAEAVKLTSKVTAKGVHTTFDLRKGEVTDDITEIVLFEPMAPPGRIADGISVPNFAIEGYTHVSIQYLLVPATPSVVDLEWTPLAAGIENKAVTMTNTPVQANYRTNIYGSLLTSSQNIFSIKISHSSKIRNITGF